MRKFTDRIIFRFVLLMMCAISLVLHFKIDDEIFNSEEFSYFTVQSNIFCFVMITVLVLRELHGKSLTTSVIVYFHGMATAAILSTAYIYHFFESVNKYSLEQNGIISIPAMDLFGHYVVPLLFVTDWFLFRPKGLVQRNYIFKWLAFPIVYLLCFLSRCTFNEETAFRKVEKFPYYFLDYETLGPVNFGKYIFIITLIMLTINTILYTLDYIFAMHKKIRHPF